MLQSLKCEYLCSPQKARENKQFEGDTRPLTMHCWSILYRKLWKKRWDGSRDKLPWLELCGDGAGTVSYLASFLVFLLPSSPWISGEIVHRHSLVTGWQTRGATPGLIKFEIVEMICGAATQTAGLPPLHRRVPATANTFGLRVEVQRCWCVTLDSWTVQNASAEHGCNL